MPIENQIIPSRRLVITRIFGEVVYEDIESISKQLISMTDFDPHFDQLVDLSGVVKVNVTSDMMRNHARAVYPYAKDSRCSVIATSDLVYGMARMYAAVQNDRREFRVFRTVMEAEAWLASSVGNPVAEYPQ
jgi:hypothetical protein